MGLPREERSVLAGAMLCGKRSPSVLSVCPRALCMVMIERDLLRRKCSFRGSMLMWGGACACARRGRRVHVAWGGTDLRLPLRGCRECRQQGCAYGSLSCCTTAAFLPSLFPSSLPPSLPSLPSTSLSLSRCLPASTACPCLRSRTHSLPIEQILYIREQILYIRKHILYIQIHTDST